MTDLYTPCTFTVSELSKCQKAFNQLQAKYERLLEHAKEMRNCGICLKCIDGLAEIVGEIK